MDSVFYVLIVLGTMVEGELVLAVACYITFKDGAPLFPVIVSGALGAYTGDLICFAWGRKTGRAVFDRWHKVAAKVARLQVWIKRFESFAVILLRFQIAMRTIGYFTLGHGGMSVRKLLTVDAFAALLWSVTACMLLYWFSPIVDLWLHLIRGG